MRLSAVAGLCVALGLAASPALSAVVLTQVDIQTFPDSFGVIGAPTINDNGYVTYTRDAPRLPGDPTRESLMLWDGNSSTSLFTTSSEFFAFASSIQLNEANAALVSVFGSGGALVRASDGTVDVLRLAGRPDGDIGRIGLANNGDALFSYNPFSASDPATIEIWRSGAPSVAFTDTAGEFARFSELFNGSGGISYILNELPFPVTRTIFLGDEIGQTAVASSVGTPVRFNDAGQLLVPGLSSTNVRPLLLIDEFGVREIANDTFSPVEFGLNDNGQIAYLRTFPGFLTPELVITDGANPQTFELTGLGTVFSVQSLQLNDAGIAVFIANVLLTSGFGGTSLSFTAGDAVQEILRSGDVLDNRTVAEIALTDDALNNNGLVAFRVRFEDLSSAIYVANLFGDVKPIPAPGALLLVLTGLAAGGFFRKRTGQQRRN